MGHYICPSSSQQRQPGTNQVFQNIFVLWKANRYQRKDPQIKKEIEIKIIDDPTISICNDQTNFQQIECYRSQEQLDLQSMFKRNIMGVLRHYQQKQYSTILIKQPRISSRQFIYKILRAVIEALLTFDRAQGVSYSIIENQAKMQIIVCWERVKSKKRQQICSKVFSKLPKFSES